MNEKKIKDMTTEELTEALYKEAYNIAVKELKTLEYKMTGLCQNAILQNGSEVEHEVVKLSDIESHVKSRVQELEKQYKVLQKS